MDFNRQYWDKKIQGYQEEAWSHQPTPFARTVARYLPDHAEILELGTGAGQDAVWFLSQGHNVTATDATEAAFDAIRGQAPTVQLQTLDITNPLPFPNESFDAVYAHLVLHYFDDHTTQVIYAEIRRVLKPGGLVAVLVNSDKDPEFDSTHADKAGITQVKGISKRFFSVASLRPYTAAFDQLLLDDEGSSVKDDAKNTFGLIRFIGKKR